MDRMREDFELWYMELKCAHGVSERDLAYEIEFDEKIGEYECANAEYAWRGWKASRAALCVELPENCKGMALTVSELHQQLDRAGVSYK